MKLFAYTSPAGGCRTGLHFAWSADGFLWNRLGPERAYACSMYGAPRTGRRIISPFLFRAPDGVWHCVAQTGEYEGTIIHFSADDLSHWNRQRILNTGCTACIDPVVEPAANGFVMHFLEKDGTCRKTSTYDWLSFFGTEACGEYCDPRQEIRLDNGIFRGIVVDVTRQELEPVIAECELYSLRRHREEELMRDDTTRFADLVTISGTWKIDTASTREISRDLIGIFYEDINYAGDGGIYAELIQNRDFEHSYYEVDYIDFAQNPIPWSPKHGWELIGEGTEFELDTNRPIHKNSPHHAVLTTHRPGAALVNRGFGGIALTGGIVHYFSLFSRSGDGKASRVRIRLAEKGRELCSMEIDVTTADWEKREFKLIPKTGATDAQLEIIPLNAGVVELDFISLFPSDTYKGRRNGMRADLVEALIELKPKFMRFPGGCIVHGNKCYDMYHWKNTVGPLESRKPLPNRWGYHQSFGLGFYEFFLLCEDIGCKPLPILHCGVSCQFTITQTAVPLQEMDEVIAEYLDLIEFANGDITTQWGAKRVEAGHPAPFNLTMIGVGNEELISDDFEIRFTMIMQAIKIRYPEIEVVGTAGPGIDWIDYREGWKVADKLGFEYLDIHYYAKPGWFIHNQDFYDRMPRNRKTKIYVGEYASHRPDRAGCGESALTEALHLTALERNADIVRMSSYAPLFGKEGFCQWNPNLIYFSNASVCRTPGYYVQKLFSVNCGDRYCFNQLNLDDGNREAHKRIAGSAVMDSETGELILKLANLLPRECKMQVRIDGAEIVPQKAPLTLLTVSPDQLQVAPQEIMQAVGPDFEFRLPPCTLAVMRLKTTLSHILSK